MPLQFFASVVTASEEEWGRLVHFGDVEMKDGSPYVMFQDSYAYSDQDVQLGQNQPYVEIQNQGWSWYGHMERVELSRDWLTLQMDVEASRHMDNDGVVRVFFALEEDAYAKLSAQLETMLRTAVEFRKKSDLVIQQKLEAKN
jgi:hypothetical protein